MQRVFLIYDIADDRIRAKIADACLDYGLDRIQLSTFTGCLSRNHQEQLMLRLKNLLDDGCGNIQLIPLSETDWKRRLEIDHVQR